MVAMVAILPREIVHLLEGRWTLFEFSEIRDAAKRKVTTGQGAT